MIRHGSQFNIKPSVNPLAVNMPKLKESATNKYPAVLVAKQIRNPPIAPRHLCMVSFTSVRLIDGVTRVMYTPSIKPFSIKVFLFFVFGVRCTCVKTKHGSKEIGVAAAVVASSSRDPTQPLVKLLRYIRGEIRSCT